MGGIGFAIDVEPAGSAPDPKTLYEEMYRLVETNVRKLAKGKPYKQVLEEYLSIAIDDGWGAKDEIFFNFKDGAGLCNMSADASYHWFELVVAALREKDAFDALAASHGLRLRWKKPTPLKALLTRCEEPLVELRGHLFSTGKLDGDIYITSDDLGDETITIDDLEKNERAKVLAAFKKKKCVCSVCAALRSKPQLVLPKPKKASKPRTAKKKTIHRYGSSLYIKDPELTSLGPEHLKGKVEGISVYDTPISDLPADLEKLPLTWLALGATKITHVPEVLTCIASLGYFQLSRNPVPLAELAKLPQIRRLVIDHWPDVPLHELPFEALPNLAELVARDCNLRTLPKLGPIKRLDATNNALETFPDAIMRVASLEDLDLGNNPLATVPRSWAALPRLRKLNLFKAPITDIGDGLDAIEELEIGQTKVERLEVAKMKSLRVLRACDTPLREIDALPAKLETLDLSNTKLTTLPDVRPAKASLKLLSLFNNETLRELPEWLGELEALETLLLAYLPTTKLPDSMQALRNLRCLHVRNMKVFPVPNWFGRLKLEELHVDRADLSRGEAARLKTLLPKTKIRIT